MPQISVIITANKWEQYLPACLDQLLAWTHQDFEVVVLDECSPDGMADVIREYAAYWTEGFAMESMWRSWLTMIPSSLMIWKNCTMRAKNRSVRIRALF